MAATANCPKASFTFDIELLSLGSILASSGNALVVTLLCSNFCASIFCCCTSAIESLYFC